jgi:hypothetical protein
LINLINEENTDNRQTGAVEELFTEKMNPNDEANFHIKEY